MLVKSLEGVGHNVFHERPSGAGLFLGILVFVGSCQKVDIIDHHHRVVVVATTKPSKKNMLSGAEFMDAT